MNKPPLFYSEYGEILSTLSMKSFLTRDTVGFGMHNPENFFQANFFIVFSIAHTGDIGDEIGMHCAFYIV